MIEWFFYRDQSAQIRSEMITKYLTESRAIRCSKDIHPVIINQNLK